MIFTQFLEMMRLLREYCSAYDIPYENIIALENDTFIVIRVTENTATKFSIFRMAKKNDNFIHN